MTSPLPPLPAERHQGDQISPADDINAITANLAYVLDRVAGHDALIARLQPPGVGLRIVDAGTGLTLPSPTQYRSVDLTLTANLTALLPPPELGNTLIVIARQDDTGGWAITFTGLLWWMNGTIPTQSASSGDIDTYAFIGTGDAWLGRRTGTDYGLPPAP